MGSMLDTMKPKVGVLAIQGSFAEHIETLEKVNLKQRFKHLKISVVEIRNPEDINEELCGLIVPGGESTTMKNFLDANFLSKLKSWVKNHNRPVWGSCAGMILLADKESGIGALDAVVLRNHFGRQRQSFTQNINLVTESVIQGRERNYPGFSFKSVQLNYSTVLF